MNPPKLFRVAARTPARVRHGRGCLWLAAAAGILRLTSPLQAQGTSAMVAQPTGEYKTTILTTGTIRYSVSAEALLNFNQTFQSQDFNTIHRQSGTGSLSYKSTLSQLLHLDAQNTGGSPSAGLSNVGGGSALLVTAERTLAEYTGVWSSLTEEGLVGGVRISNSSSDGHYMLVSFAEGLMGPSRSGPTGRPAYADAVPVTAPTIRTLASAPTSAGAYTTTKLTTIRRSGPFAGGYSNFGWEGSVSGVVDETVVITEVVYYRWVCPPGTLQAPSGDCVPDPQHGTGGGPDLGSGAGGAGIPIRLSFDDLNPTHSYSLTLTVNTLRNGEMQTTTLNATIPPGSSAYTYRHNLVLIPGDSLVSVSVALFDGGTLLIHHNLHGSNSCPQGTELVDGSCRPVCPPGTVRAGTTGKCCPPGQVLNALGQCGDNPTPCPPNQVMVNGTCTCAPGYVGVTINSATVCLPVCPPCQHRVPGETDCVLIDAAKPTYNPVTRVCEEPCPEGQTRDINGRCCPFTHISLTGVCGCPPGTVRVGTDCLPPCPPGLIFDSLGRCIDPRSPVLYEDTPKRVPIP